MPPFAGTWEEWRRPTYFSRPSRSRVSAFVGGGRGREATVVEFCHQNISGLMRLTQLKKVGRILLSNQWVESKIQIHGNIRSFWNHYGAIWSSRLFRLLRNSSQPQFLSLAKNFNNSKTMMVRKSIRNPENVALSLFVIFWNAKYLTNSLKIDKTLSRPLRR